MVAMVMYQKAFCTFPFTVSQKTGWKKGCTVPRETAARWYNYCSLEYLSPVYEVMHQELLAERDPPCRRGTLSGAS
ncbi:MAG: hypothetical protein ACLUAL_12330 [Blautia wexlerae]